MQSCNIIDRRTNRNDDRIMVVFEDNWHNFPDELPNEDVVVYLGIRNTTINLALKYAAQEWAHPISIFLYDTGVDNHINFETIQIEDGKLRLV